MIKSKFQELPKTKQMITKALLNLMIDHSFDSITITELCHIAQVGRKTYYRHYHSKHEIIIIYLSSLMEDAMETVHQSMPNNLQDILTSYFTYWQNHSDLINLLRQHQLCYLMVSVCEHYFESEKANDLPLINNMPKVMTIFTFSGATRVLQKWIYDDMALTPKDLTLQLINSIKLNI